jgi:hypothetical protein
MFNRETFNAWSHLIPTLWELSARNQNRFSTFYNKMLYYVVKHAIAFDWYVIVIIVYIHVYRKMCILCGILYNFFMRGSIFAKFCVKVSNTKYSIAKTIVNIALTISCARPFFETEPYYTCNYSLRYAATFLLAVLVRVLIKGSLINEHSHLVCKQGLLKCSKSDYTGLIKSLILPMPVEACSCIHLSLYHF